MEDTGGDEVPVIVQQSLSVAPYAHTSDSNGNLTQKYRYRSTASGDERLTKSASKSKNSKENKSDKAKPVKPSGSNPSAERIKKLFPSIREKVPLKITQKAKKTFLLDNYETMSSRDKHRFRQAYQFKNNHEVLEYKAKKSDQG